MRECLSLSGSALRSNLNGLMHIKMELVLTGFGPSHVLKSKRKFHSISKVIPQNGSQFMNEPGPV